ncbi:hypothetical protein DOT_5994 [Desulfosporosinus sp. OT]|nr:hypothetical protein DOT_5994 [Desulfosporosinus sp. OT]
MLLGVIIEASVIVFINERMVVVCVCVVANVGRLLAKSKPEKVMLPSHIRTDEEIGKKLSTFHKLTRLVDGFGPKV